MTCDLGRIEFQWRNANALPLLQPILAVGALAVDAQLAFADDALDVGERQAGKARLKKAVDAHVVLVRGHHHGLNFSRERRRLNDGLDRLLGKWRGPRRAWRRRGKTAGLAARTMRF